MWFLLYAALDAQPVRTGRSAAPSRRGRWSRFRVQPMAAVGRRDALEASAARRHPFWAGSGQLALAGEITRHIEQTCAIGLTTDSLFADIAPYRQRLAGTALRQDRPDGTAIHRTIARRALAARAPPGPEEGRTERHDVRRPALRQSRCVAVKSSLPRRRSMLIRQRRLVASPRLAQSGPDRPKFQRTAIFTVMLSGRRMARRRLALAAAVSATALVLTYAGGAQASPASAQAQVTAAAARPAPPACPDGSGQAPLYRDTSYSFAERAADLVSCMT